MAGLEQPGMNDAPEITVEGLTEEQKEKNYEDSEALNKAYESLVGSIDGDRLKIKGEGLGGETLVRSSRLESTPRFYQDGSEMRHHPEYSDNITSFTIQATNEDGTTAGNKTITIQHGRVEVDYVAQNQVDGKKALDEVRMFIERYNRISIGTNEGDEGDVEGILNQL